jgi:DNA-directed RNA polymerase subunit alpha
MSDPTSADAAILDTLDFGVEGLDRARGALKASREARSAIVAAASETGGDARSSLRRATALYLLGRLREAADALRAAGDSPQAKLVRGRVALEDSDPAGALDALSPLLGSPSDGARLALDVATAAALAGDVDAAKSAAARVGKEGADGLFAAGVAAEAAGDKVAARTKYEAAVEQDASHARALFRLALLSDTLGDDDRAMELYRRCVALEPTYVNALLNLGVLLEDHDRFAEAEVLYRRVLAADPAHERARLFLRDVESAQNMYFDEDTERKEDRRNQILRTPISEFELSVRSRNCLAKMEIKTLGDLITRTEQELLAYKNFGETSLQEIKDILAQKGLRLGMGREEGAAAAAATREEAEAELEALFAGSDEDDADEDLEDEVEGDGKAPLSAEVAPAAGGTGEDPRGLPIDALDLSTRARRSVEALEIETIGDLADRTFDELQASKQFGATSLTEIRRKLATFGLALKGEGPPGGDVGED